MLGKFQKYQAQAPGRLYPPHRTSGGACVYRMMPGLCPEEEVPKGQFFHDIAVKPSKSRLCITFGSDVGALKNTHRYTYGTPRHGVMVNKLVSRVLFV